MRALIQRVSQARVVVEGVVRGEVGRGLLVLLGVGRGDDVPEARWLAEKILHLRLFEDGEGKMNRSVLEEGGGILLVSQFTLYGDCRRGRRPGFGAAADPALARRLYGEVGSVLEGHPVKVAYGVFQTHMEVHLVNDGPVTLAVSTPGDAASGEGWP